MAKRDYGSGSVQAVKDKGGNPVPNKWSVLAWVQSPWTGERKRVKRRVSGSKRDALRALKDMEANPSRFFEDPSAEAAETFAAYAAEWLGRRRVEVAAETLKESTYENYSEHVRTLSAHLGGLLLEDVTARAINKALDAIRREKSERLGRQVSESTMKKVFVTLNQIMKAAYCEDLVTANPCDKAARPRASHAQREALEVSEARRLLRVVREAEAEAVEAFYRKESALAAGGHANKPREHALGCLGASRVAAVRIALGTGLRLGEVLALRWCDVDFSAGALNVRHSLTKRGGLTDTKTHQARRVPVDAETLGALGRLKRFHGEVAAACGGSEVAPANQFVCCSNTFGPLNKSNFETWWCRWREANGFGGLKFHELRHTYGTILANSGVPITAVQRNLGHASATTTASFYLHADESQAMAAAAVLSAVLNAEGETPGNVVSLGIA